MNLVNRTVICTNGIGRDSVAGLVGMKQRGIRPQAVVFADVGSEKPETYAYIPILRDWLKRVNFPDLTIVKYEPVSAPYKTIEGNMVMNATLPGATFNWGSCTMKFKIEPQNKWANNNEMCQKAWARGERIAKLIFFEADEEYRRDRAADKAHGGAGSKDAEKFEYFYPLIEWKWTLERCIEEIKGEGLPVPIKSACFFCPNQKPHEVDALNDEQRARIIRIELAAEPYNRKVHGLWRRPVKKSGMPGSITQYILERGLSYMPLEELERIDPMPLNEKCQKFKNGFTFKPPHEAPRLADLLKQYEQKARDKEHDQHMGAVENI